jgi:hypothetical protein
MGIFLVYMLIQKGCRESLCYTRIEWAGITGSKRPSERLRYMGVIIRPKTEDSRFMN